MARFGCIMLVRYVSYPKISYKLLINSRFRYKPVNYYTLVNRVYIAYRYDENVASSLYLPNNIILCWINEKENIEISMFAFKNDIRFQYNRNRIFNGRKYLLNIEINNLGTYPYVGDVELFKEIRYFQTDNIYALFNEVLSIVLRFTDDMMLKMINDGELSSYKIEM